MAPGHLADTVTQSGRQHGSTRSDPVRAALGCSVPQGPRKGALRLSWPGSFVPGGPQANGGQAALPPTTGWAPAATGPVPVFMVPAGVVTTWARPCAPEGQCCPASAVSCLWASSGNQARPDRGP